MSERQTIELPCRVCGEMFTDWRDRHVFATSKGIHVSKSTICAGCKEADSLEIRRCCREKYAQRETTRRRPL